MATADNLILGSAEIFTAPVGTAFVQGSTSGWTSLGHTTAAVTLTDTPSYVMASSQQAARALDVGISSIETQVTTTLREIDAARLASFVNGSYQGGPISPGGQGMVSKFALLVVGAGPAGGTIELHAPRAVYTGNRSLSFDAENFSEVEVEITILDDSTTGGFTVYVSAGAGQQANGGGDEGGGYTPPPSSFNVAGSYVSDDGNNYTFLVGDITAFGWYDNDSYSLSFSGWASSSGYSDQDPYTSGTLSPLSVNLDSGTPTAQVVITGNGNINAGEIIYLDYAAFDSNGDMVMSDSIEISIPGPS